MILREIKNMYFPALQRIEYLESNGMQYINGRRAPGLQYIDTGVLMDSANAFIGTTVEFEVLELATDIKNTALIAGALTSAYDGYNCLVYRGDIYPSNCFSFSQTEQALNTKITATIYKNVNYIPNQNFILFGRSVGSPNRIEYYGIKRIYSCKIIKNGDTIRDFIPVRVGTKGYMFDKVSGELYGNSGTGDFVLGPDVGYINSSKNLQQIYQNRLIEGVDYETADWLKGDIPISTRMMMLPINSKNFEFERNFIQLMNTSYFYTYANSGKTYMYFMNQTYNPKIYDSTLQRTVFTGNNLGSGVHTIIANDNEIVISSATNTTTLQWYGNPQYVIFNNGNNLKKNTIHLTSPIKVDGVTRYVPCKLLRPIPRNLDAQCKSRVAGECGMIDLKSGRFYGNVADSGAFSLEWDEWLKDCSIQIDMEQTLGITNYAPPTIVYKGRIDTTKLTSELVDFGFVKISNSQIVCNQQTWSFSNWGTNKWATIAVSYGGVGGCNVKVNGTDVGSQTEQVTGIFNPHIFLYDIVQLNKIDYTFYPNQSDPTYSVNLIFSRGVDESIEKQYMTDNDGATYRIYAD